ncbi:hypothetical protein I316_05871 [Kwoniella heveanensis BCC8398]|uniref:Uncharacterized protein n=1 Tax=Kwoniella heveanensis BCC8398 TaxID=1296120 RepID=A0A1B9GNM6_9TREE|nr:hypothetical protein I316_05871 [Kwoniella heveanensis BCC8398]
MASIKEAIVFNVTRPFPFRRAFHIWSLIFALATLVIISVWASATAGYESVTVLGQSFNTTDNDHWYSPFLVRSSSLCEPAIFNPGSSFSTSNSVFTWKMESDLNNHGTINGYKGTSLSRCDVSYIYIDIDLTRVTVTTQAIAMCTDVEFPAQVRSEFVWSDDPNRASARLGWTSNNQLDTASHDAVDILFALGDLAGDLWKRLRAIYRASEQQGSIALGFSAVSAYSCAIAEDHDGCFQLHPHYNVSDTFQLDSNLTVDHSPIDLELWQTPVDNFLLAYHSAIRYDLGSPMGSNIFSNATALSSQISSTDTTNANQTGILPALTGAETLIGYEALPLDPPKAAVIDTHFLCHVKQIKSPASFIVSVAGLSLSLFSSIWGAYILFMTLLIKRQIENQEANQASGGDTELGKDEITAASYEPVHTSDRGTDGYVLN